MERKEELNYKEAYYFLFNQMTDLITYIKSLQSKAEEICTDEPSPVQTELDKKYSTPE